MSNLKFRNIHFIIGFLLAMLTIPQVSNAQGNLLITPRRVVFDGSRRVMDITLANTGIDTATYNISLIQYRMNEDGSFTEISEPDPGQKFADGNLRFFPRRVTLAPNEAQMVKMQVTNLNKLEPGEYRSHAYFRSVPIVTALGEEAQNIDSTALSIQLIPIFGISIPVIIRVGTSDMSATISDMKLQTTPENTKQLSIKINREGSMSVYGDIQVTHVAPSGVETVLSNINGLAVYTPNKSRIVNIDLNPEKEIDYTTGKLVVTFVGQSNTKPQKYTEEVFNLK
ncbi:MAG: hypothetical protein WCR71_07285 [Bacteroidales bacterium]